MTDNINLIPIGEAEHYSRKFGETVQTADYKIGKSNLTGLLNFRSHAKLALNSALSMVPSNKTVVAYFSRVNLPAPVNEDFEKIGNPITFTTHPFKPAGPFRPDGPTNKREFLNDYVDGLNRVIQSYQGGKLLGGVITVSFIMGNAGGNYTYDETIEPILKRTTIIQIKNTDNNCFWYSMLVSYNKINNILNNTNTKIDISQNYALTKAKDIYLKCYDENIPMLNFEFNTYINFLQLPYIEEKLNTNIYIINVRGLIFKQNINLNSILAYKSEYRNNGQHYLLYDNINKHFHVITDIRKFFGSGSYCDKCLTCFKLKENYDKHLDSTGLCRMLSNEEIEINNKCKVIEKDCKNFMSSVVLKGSQHEINNKIFMSNKKNVDEIIEKIKNPKYIIFDFETDTNKKIDDIGAMLLHQVMHVEVDVLEVSDNNKYEDSLIENKSFTGYDSLGEFCEWLFTKNNLDSTVMAHNGAGYDNKFILQYCVNKGMNPEMVIRQGSRITYLHFKKFNIRFIDTIHFFNKPLRKLPEIFDIKETVKGFFPHKFNIKDNQDYIGVIPDIEYYGYKNMKVEEAEEFIEWHNENKNITDWNFKKEMIKYCRADVEVLSRAVLSFRKMFYDNLDIDPFRYITLASLCMNIYKGKFLPDKSIVSNDAYKPMSIKAEEWLSTLDLKNVKRNKSKLINLHELKDFKVHENKINNNEKIYYNPTDECFHSKFSPDIIDETNKIIYEFYGCKYHGCRKCFKAGVDLYNSTMERENILKASGYKIISKWECHWEEEKLKLNEKKLIEETAKLKHLNIRDALFGGRTEAFKSYVKCQDDEEIYYYDVVSLYPTVNALDKYPVGYKNHYMPTLDEISNGSFIGVVKCTVTPPTDLYIPVLPQSAESKLLFHLKPMTGTWCSVELKKAIEKGYIINCIHSAFKYEEMTGLMKSYVEYFLKIKTCNSGVKNAEECKKLNASHHAIGLNIDIEPFETFKNPGMKEIAKLCLNSLWGKFGQRTGMDSYEYFDESLQQHFMRKIMDKRYTIKEWEIVNSNCVELKYCNVEDSDIEQNYISEITASFTTANARMRLYDMLDWLHPSQICYCDTDSVMFIYNKNNKLHKLPSNDALDLPASVKFGKGLGEWENEMSGGAYIKELVVGGAKSYAYMTNEIMYERTRYILNKKIKNIEYITLENFNKIKCQDEYKIICDDFDKIKYKQVIKQKGITMDVANSAIITFETMRDMVINNNKLISDSRYTFAWTKDKDVVTKFLSRTIRSTVDTKRTLTGYDTLPFGFSVS